VSSLVDRGVREASRETRRRFRVSGSMKIAILEQHRNCFEDGNDESRVQVL
jgi:hypothetical protein